ncbi:MAG: S41 family peptidase [Gammaproteobacteria bacterium]|nr:S41 family peptidase [Gammaproteobacteria bacterium]
MRIGTKTLLTLVIGTTLGFALSVGSGVMAQRDQSRDSLPWDEARLLAEVLERVRQEYVEPVDDRDLIEGAVRGLVTELDSHSQFLDTEQYAEIRINTSGNYSGVGLEVNMDDNKVVVVTPIDDSPAAKAGIYPGDEILQIDELKVSAGNVAEVLGRMRGKPGTTVDIVIARVGEPASLEFTLVRSHVQVRSVKAHLLESDYGYLRITHFSDTTYADMRESLLKLKRSNGNSLKGLLLDLRNNPGGVLNAAVEVSDAFLDEGTIVSASGRAADASFRHEANPGDLLSGAKIVVLVNEGSASASEIVAGALQDNRRALIVGTRTFGKGSVQTVIPLSSGRAIKLTTSLYYTPSGVSIHGEGISPDKVLAEDKFADLQAGVSSHQTNQALALLQADSQLQAAVRLLKEPRALQTHVLH